MSDDGEAELTQDDKRILKYVADAAREEMPSRRGFIQGGTAAAVLGALGFGAGSATAQTQAAGQVGTENNPVDVEGATVNTERLGNTHVFASAYGSDGAAIQSALNEHGSNPSTVHIDVAVSALSAAPLEIPSNTTVVVEEDITLADSTPENILQTKDAFTQTATNGTLQSNVQLLGGGGVLDGNKTNQSSEGDGFAQNCVHLFADNVRVENLTCVDAKYHNISAAGESSNLRVSNNMLKRGGISNVQIHYKSSGSNTDFGDLVTDCTLRGNTSIGGGDFGLKFAGVADSKILDNTVIDSNGAAIRAKDGDQPAQAPDSVKIRGNTIENPAGPGVEVYTEATNSVGAITGFSVVDNDIYGVGGYGIIYEDLSGAIIDGSINDNLIKTAGNNAMNIKLSGYSINSNVIEDSAGRGINQASGTDNIISDNVVRNTTNAAITSQSGTTVTDNVTP